MKTTDGCAYGGGQYCYSGEKNPHSIIKSFEQNGIERVEIVFVLTLC